LPIYAFAIEHPEGVIAVDGVGLDEAAKRLTHQRIRAYRGQPSSARSRRARSGEASTRTSPLQTHARGESETRMIRFHTSSRWPTAEQPCSGHCHLLRGLGGERSEAAPETHRRRRFCVHRPSITA
jgi:hypothetical protein